MSKSEFVSIGDLPEGTAVEYSYGTMDFSNPGAGVQMHTVKGYVGPRTTNHGSSRERVVLMKTKTTGVRIGTVDPRTSVKVR